MEDLICGFEKMSMVDYDGKICSTIFLGKCNFRCPFCHNSSLVENYNNVDKFDFNEILNYLNKRKGVVEAVCITGGEPTLYKDLKEMIIEIKKLGLFVKLDTNGSNPDVIKDLVNNKLIDYIAMDIKNSFSKYIITTGIYNINIEKIKESINFIMNSNIDYEFRTTLVKELHSLEDIYEIKDMIKGAKKYFLQCFIDNGECLIGNLTKVEKEEAEAFKRVLEKDILNVSLRSYE
jgi:pyruvate formate lyase activating enzyme